MRIGITVNSAEWKFLNSIDGIEIGIHGYYSPMVDDLIHDVNTYTQDATWYLEEFLKERELK